MSGQHERQRSPRRDLIIGLGRAAAGALLFTLPILMTMETWQLGVTVPASRLLLLLALTLPLLVGLSRIGGFRRTSSLAQDMADAAIAIGIAGVVAAGVLGIFGVISDAMPASEVLGKLAIQITPGAVGALFGRAQLGASNQEDAGREEVEESYAGELFVMVAGALFLSLNIAPTEEVVLIAWRMSLWQQLGLLAASLIVMHALVYQLEFIGGHGPRTEDGFWSLFLRFTVTGYVLVALVSLYVLWTIGRLDGTGPVDVAGVVIVLSFPGAVGAAAARIIV
ncbi:TIGR02587 family membrane protein (plasmid) [Tistrella mobilis]|uniref:TIGR02587 family membrane protein n=1 Tax=Tistrella mobilis TaxID=171437 RepID=UPI003556F0E0